MGNIASAATVIAIIFVDINADVDVEPQPYDPVISVKAQERRVSDTRGSTPSPRPATLSTAEPPTSQASNLPQQHSYVPPDYLGGTWIDYLDFGSPDEDPTPVTATPSSTTDLRTEILRAARRVELPSIDIRTQPGDTTLVNIETILYADADTLWVELELLGYAVELRARPSGFTWHHGDGTTQSTTDQGRPYPNHTVSHRYTRTHESVDLSVDITYAVDYRVDGGSWATLSETLTAAGTSQTLTVRQATPLLVRP